MSFNKYLYIFILVVVASGAKAQQTDSSYYDLKKCLAIAIKNNLQVKQSNYSMMTDSVNYLQSKENLLPEIDGSASRTLSQGRALSPVTNTYVNQALTSDNYGLNGSLTLFNGLANQNSIKQTRLAYMAGKMSFQSAKDLVTLNIITAYLNVLDAQEQYNQTTSQLAVAKETLDRGETLEKQGANTTASAIYDLRGSYASSEVSLTTAKNAIISAKVTLFQYMNIPYDTASTLQPLNAQDLAGEYGSDPNQVYQTALNQLAAVKAAIYSRQSAEKGVQYAKSLLYPSLVLSGGISTNYSSAGQRSVFVDSSSVNTGMYINSAGGKQYLYANEANYANQNIGYFDQFKNNYGTYVTLGLSIPIFDKRYKKNQVAIAKINLLNSQALEENTKTQLQQQVQQAYYNMAAAYSRFKSLQNEVTAYTESFRISKLRFESGVLTSVDYITSKNNMDSASLALISARYDYYIYSKILDYYQGKLSF